jgi:CRP-like cAMP-binding protein
MMLLRNVPMFAGLVPDDLEELALVVQERIFMPNDDLCREGDSGDAVFVVVKGKVRVFTTGSGGERTLSELGAGACIGEMAVLDSAPRSATVRALERTRAVIIPGDGFKQLLSERPEMSLTIVGELVRRMRGMMASR